MQYNNLHWRNHDSRIYNVNNDNYHNSQLQYDIHEIQTNYYVLLLTFLIFM